MTGHSLESLQEMYDRLLAEQEKRYMQMFKTAEEAVVLAKHDIEKKLDSMNEIRRQLNDQAATFLTKENFESKHDSIVKQIDDLRLSKATLEGKASQQSVNMTLFIAVIGLLIGLVSIIMYFFK